MSLNPRQEKLLVRILKIALPVSFLWIFIETVENAVLFYNFFPRGGFFKLALNATVLKFILWPVVKLSIMTGCVYVAVSCVCAWMIVTALDVLQQKKQSSVFNIIFTMWSLYTFVYGILGVNAFLHPQSYNRHPFMYTYMFPQGAGPSDIPQVNFVNPFHYVCAVYWSVVLGICLVSVWRKNRKILLGVICFLVVILALVKSFNILSGERFHHKENIILIGLDSFQYNQLSPEWGANSSPAPDILNFVKESVYFRHVWTPFARTFPSYISVLTGRYPFHNGIRANLLPDRYEDLDNVYLGNILKENGYWRFYATDDVRFSNIRTRHGFDDIFTPEKRASGFLLASFYDYALSNIFMYYDVCPGLFSAVNNNRASAAYNPKVFMRHVIRRINKLPREKKQFIVLHLCGNHHPYTAVYPYARDPAFRTRSEVCMRMVNDQVRMLLAYLKKSGLYKTSLIILFSDHGSGWTPARQDLSHGSDFEFLEAYKSILAFKGAGLPRAKEIESRVRTIDIYPTILDFLGVRVPVNIDGQTMVPLMYGTVQEPPRSVFAETGYAFDFRYEENAHQQSQRIQSEVKRFQVDPETGYIFINDEDYQDILTGKWFMMIKGTDRLIYRPLTGEIRLYHMDGTEILDDNKKQEMKHNIETFMLK